MTKRTETFWEDVDYGLWAVSTAGLVVLLSPVIVTAWVVGRIRRYFRGDNHD